MTCPLCPRCHTPVRRLQRAMPRPGPAGPACAYPCQCWLTQPQARTVAQQAIAAKEPPMRNPPDCPRCHTATDQDGLARPTWWCRTCGWMSANRTTTTTTPTGEEETDTDVR